MAGMTPDQKSAFLAALSVLARAFQTYAERTGADAILVGGASVIILTGGQFFSGDFDFLAADDSQMAECLADNGFVREDRAGFLHAGWYHPEHPLFGFQQVSGSLFDGRTERSRMLRVSLRDGGAVVLPPVEDMVADRLGQHAMASATDTSRLDQAMIMLAAASEIDRTYLLRRVAEEGGDIDPLLDYIPEATREEPEGET